MSEEFTVGNVIFELDRDPEGWFTVDVRKVDDLEGWVTFVPCPIDEFEWSEIRNRCFPFNGKSTKPPLGQWVVHEFVGKESASINLVGSRAEFGFTNEDILSITAMVNLAFKSLDPRSRRTGNTLQSKLFTH